MKAMISIHPKGLVSMFQLPRSTALMVLFGLGVLSGACQSQTKPVELSIKMVNVPAGSFMMADRGCKLREVRSIDGSVPKVSDVVVLDQGFTFPDGKAGCLVYGINEAGEYCYEAEVYESELGHDSHS